jgi:hypothetical protein
MPRSVVGLLAALGVLLSSLLAYVHGDFTPLVVLGSASATGLAAYLALPPSKKTSLASWSGNPSAVLSDGFCQVWAQPIP